MDGEPRSHPSAVLTELDRALVMQAFLADAEWRATTIDDLADALEAALGDAERGRRRGQLSFEIHNLRGAAAIAQLEELRANAERLERALERPTAAAPALASAARAIVQQLRSHLAAGVPVSGVESTAADFDERPVVLHVDDHPANLKLVERILVTRPDVRLVEAANGEQGLSLARRFAPVLVLLDLRLPDIPGDEVIRRLRDDPATSDLLIVVVSAEARPAETDRLLAAGADAFLVKPLDIEAVLDVVDAATKAHPR